MTKQSRKRASGADQTLTFATPAAFRAWLAANHATNAGIWLTLGKSGGPKTLSADEALGEALCFGWIDGLIKSIDSKTYIKRFTPRRKGSEWSARNRKIAAELVAAGRMTDAGAAAIAAAKKAGTWEIAATPIDRDAAIASLTQALADHKKALANYEKMAPSCRRTYAMHYTSAAKEETRIRRLEQIVLRLNENKKPM